ncbi:MAG: hypothetical protein J5616_02495 [Bacteroidaceae bacterium]|nr:hypothetical protein [Bacteroidaceae bacterium]
MNFNKERFANFAKYDLTINKSFYRNLAFVTIAGTVCVALLGFFARYNIYDAVVNDTMSGSAYSYVPDPNSFEGYNWIYITAGIEMALLTSVFMAVFAGCWAHNLRNKQGRITELTLPATNLEKFTWHALLMLVGGLITCFVALLAADGINALLTLIVYGTENGITSLTATTFGLFNVSKTLTDVFGPLGFTNYKQDVSDAFGGMENFYTSMSFIVICSFVLNIIIYLFGNALKYKYNIILTYIALQVIGTVISVGFSIGAGMFGGRVLDRSSEDVISDITTAYYVLGSVFLVFAGILVWKSYNLYTKAQITSPLNRN